MTFQCGESEKGVSVTILQKHPVALPAEPCQTELGISPYRKRVSGYGIWNGMIPLVHLWLSRNSAIRPQTLEGVKPLSAPKRLQPILMLLQWYHVEIRYHPEQLLVLAYTMSRAYIPTISELGEGDQDIV